MLIESRHLLKPILGSIQDPFERNISPQSQDVGIHPIARSIFFAGEVADAIDQAAESNAFEALAQGLRAAVLEDDVGAVVAGDAHDFLVPI